MNKIWTVIKFTYINRFRSRSFIVTTIVLVLLMSALANLPTVINHFTADKVNKVGIFEQPKAVTTMLQQYFNKQENGKLKLVLLQDQGSVTADETFAKKQLADKKIEGYLMMKEKGNNLFPDVIYKSEGTRTIGIASTLQPALQYVKTELAVKDVGLTQAQQQKLFSPISFTTEQVSTQGETTRNQSQIQLAYILVYVLLMLLYIGVLGNGNMVAMEITAEKSSRVMELLISSVSPLKQMYGKIIGIGLLGLTQILVFMVVGFINLKEIQGNQIIEQMHLNFNDIQYSLIIYFLLFYILGYFIFATLYAAVGSLVSRTEDVGQAMMPLTLLVVAGFMIAIFGLQAPNSPFIVAMSFFPFFTPLTMFLRIGMANPPFWQILLSIIDLFLSILAMGWLAAKIYRTGVLMYGKRPNLKELRKAMKAYKM